ncbi:hypothetical protein TRVA0_057S00760 [Trichomonascus vanleenenianus]|uniref:uncharacterized protein n=1 Tax=Trichomonascus vanleenenianus TaxID=2268995 RepID=UPI003ECAED2C
MDAKEFYSEFNKRKAQIEADLNSVASIADKNACFAQIQELTALCKSALHYLPQHDQKIYTEAINELSEKANGTQRKAKFSFGSKKRAAKKPAEPTINTATYDNEANQEKPLGVNEVTTKITAVRDAEFRDSDQTGNNLDISDVLKSTLILAKPYSSAHIDNVKSSLVYIAHVSGPIYVTNAQDSIFIVNCHQFRIHTSKNLEIYISCKSRRPIIEKCSILQFAYFPKCLADANEELYDWDDVDDFNWLRKTQSINWSRLSSPRDFQYLLKTEHPNSTTQNIIMN